MDDCMDLECMKKVNLQASMIRRFKATDSSLYTREESIRFRKACLRVERAMDTHWRGVSLPTYTKAQLDYLMGEMKVACIPPPPCSEQ
jgi:hypothetical protein